VLPLFTFPTRPRCLILASLFFSGATSRGESETEQTNTHTHRERVHCLMYQLLFFGGADQLVNKHQLVMLTKDCVDTGHMPCNLNVCVCLNNLMIRRDSFFVTLWSDFSPLVGKLREGRWRPTVCGRWNKLDVLRKSI
jgi:hypothetical protein